MKRYIYLSLLVSATTIAQDYKIHVVETGETLSEILEDKNMFPIYSEMGSLENTIFTNEKLHENDGNLIIPGQSLKLYPAGTPQDPIINSELHNDNKDDLIINNTKYLNYRHHTLTPSILTGFLGVYGEDNSNKSGEILSKLFYGVGLKWKKSIYRDYILGLNFDYIKVNIEDVDANTKLSNTEQNVKRLGISLNKEFPYLNLVVGFNRQDQVFYKSISTNAFGVSTLKNNQVLLAINKDVYSYRSSIFNLGFKLNVNNFESPSDLDINSGIGYGSYLKYKRANQPLSATLIYNVDNLDTTSTDISFKSLTLRFEYEFDFSNGGNN